MNVRKNPAPHCCARRATAVRIRSTLAQMAISAVGMLAAMAPAAVAQEAYPNRPVKIVVPYPPGGTTDLLARAVAARLTESMKQSFIVENRGGASGSIGTSAVARAAPDGYTLPHMSGELLKSMSGADLLHVPYKGGGPMLIDLIGGQIEFGFDNLPSSMPHIRAGKIRPIAVTTTERWPGAPEIPTIAESGLPGYEVSAWFGLLAPAGTPKAVVDQLQQAVLRSLRSPELAAQLMELGAKPVGNTPAEFAAMIAAELEKWRKVAATSKLN